MFSHFFSLFLIETVIDSLSFTFLLDLLGFTGFSLMSRFRPQARNKKWETFSPQKYFSKKKTDERKKGKKQTKKKKNEEPKQRERSLSRLICGLCALFFFLRPEFRNNHRPWRRERSPTRPPFPTSTTTKKNKKKTKTRWLPKTNRNSESSLTWLILVEPQ